MLFKSSDILKIYFCDEAEFLGYITKTVLLYLAQ